MNLKQTIQNIVLRARLLLGKRKARQRKDLVGPYVTAFLAETGQGRFLVDSEDLVVGGALSRTGAYGLAEIERIKRLVTRESRVLVVGAHVGALAIPVAKEVYEVVVVEANPTTSELLRLNVLINDAKNINVMQVAASDSRGQIEFVLSRHNSGGSKRRPVVGDFRYFYDDPRITRVSSDRLDDIFMGPFDVIIMDIEGSELFALKGMPRLLASSRHLIVEFLPHHIRNVARGTVDDFLDLVEPHFSSLFIPSKQVQVARPQYRKVIQDMFEKDQGDEGLVFSRHSFAFPV